MTTQRTPTPWKIFADGENIDIRPENNEITICTIQNEDYLPSAIEKRNAAFIVKAVNCHDELVQALEECLQNNVNDLLDTDMTADEIEGCGHVIKARKAIAKAKG